MEGTFIGGLSGFPQLVGKLSRLFLSEMSQIDPTQTRRAATVRRDQIASRCGSQRAPPLASSAPLSHFPIMHSDFSLFRERLAHAAA